MAFEYSAIDPRSAIRLKQRRDTRDPSDHLTVGIDQSLSNTAMVLLNRDGRAIERVVHHTGDSTTAKYKEKIKKGFKIFGEFFPDPASQVCYMIDKMVSTIRDWNPNLIGIEGLAFDARSNTERQLAGIYFGFISRMRSELLYSVTEEVHTVVPSQAKKFARELLPLDDRYIPATKAGAKPKLNKMAKPDMLKALLMGTEDQWIVDGYTRDTLVASRFTETGIHDLPDAYFIGKTLQQQQQFKSRRRNDK